MKIENNLKWNREAMPIVQRSFMMWYFILRFDIQIPNGVVEVYSCICQGRRKWLGRRHLANNKFQWLKRSCRTARIK